MKNRINNILCKLFPLNEININLITENYYDVFLIQNKTPNILFNFIDIENNIGNEYTNLFVNNIKEKMLWYIYFTKQRNYK
jgi:hypothetical protein